MSGVSATYACVVGLEFVATSLTFFLSKFLKTDPTRSFVLALLVPITWLTLADILTLFNIVFGWGNKPLLEWMIIFQIVWNNTAVLTFLIGSLVFLFTSAYVVRNKQVPKTWPWYILIVLFSMILSIAEYFEAVLLHIPRYLLHGSFCISAAAMIILMIAIPIYSHFTPHSTMSNTTDQAVFNAKWRLFWAYLYMIIPSIRSIFVIIRAIGELDPNWKKNQGQLLLDIQSIIDLAGSLLYLIPVYFFLPAYRSCLFFCYKSREMNPHFFFVKVIPIKPKDRRLSFNKVMPADAGGKPIVELQETSLEDVVENHRYRRETRKSQSRSPSPPVETNRRRIENENETRPSNPQRLSIASLARNEHFTSFNNLRPHVPPSSVINKPFAHGEIGSLIHHPLPPLRNTFVLFEISNCLVIRSLPLLLSLPQCFSSLFRMSFNLLIVCHVIFNGLILLATVYLIRSLNRSRTRDYVYYHLICISLCIILKEVVDCIELLYLLTSHSDVPPFIDGVHKSSFILPLTYLALGSIAFLFSANSVYSKDDEHADGMIIKAIFSVIITISIIFSIIFTTGNDEAIRITLLFVIASWAFTGFTVLAMSTRFIVHHSSDPLAKRQFFLCILFVLITLLIHVSGLSKYLSPCSSLILSFSSAWALVSFAEVSDRSRMDSSENGAMGVKVMFELYPVISLTLAFSFFPSVRHGLRLLLHPPPRPLSLFPSPSDAPLPYHLAISNTFPSSNRIAPKSSISHTISSAQQVVIYHEEAPAYAPMDIRLPGQLYKFNQSNRLGFYEYVKKFILEQSQCAIITKPYWNVDEGKGGEVFTIFPDLECTICDGVERFKCKDVHKFTNHVIFCLSKKGSLNGEEVATFYHEYGLVPTAVQNVVQDARKERDHLAVCIAPVLDHRHIKELADIQRKERDKITNELAREPKEEKTMGPTGPVLKLAKGAEMPLDRSVWIQTPLSSELAVLLLAGMQPIRHSPTGIHLPVVIRDTGHTKVIHLHVDRFEELASVRLAEQNWELMQSELQQVNLPMNGYGKGQPRTGVTSADPNFTFDNIMGNGMSSKPLLTEQMITQKIVADVNKERARIEREKKRIEDENRKAVASHASGDRSGNDNGDNVQHDTSSNDIPCTSNYT
ncbi:xbx-9 [Pristionchus pacificus]|uniref:Uncharacterized protein n=1 Tax=Pristionchus pacificus TaxID=54126 RepID=A0A2A6BDT8_PRIPA|nr:xbx-9 [Pristionchus pacificus]|eukprot:PDM64034.1 hypothetical protein PRIPAC_54278 [Pristionchus pacificus]